MTLSWQDIAAAVIIAAAAIYFVMRLFRLGPWKQKPFCDSCETCGIAQEDLLSENYCPDTCQQINCEQHPPADVDKRPLRRPEDQEDKTQQRP